MSSPVAGGAGFIVKLPRRRRFQQFTRWWDATKAFIPDGISAGRPHAVRLLCSWPQPNGRTSSKSTRCRVRPVMTVISAVEWTNSTRVDARDRAAQTYHNTERGPGPATHAQRRLPSRTGRPRGGTEDIVWDCSIDFSQDILIDNEKTDLTLYQGFHTSTHCMRASDPEEGHPARCVRAARCRPSLCPPLTCSSAKRYTESHRVSPARSTVASYSPLTGLYHATSRVPPRLPRRRPPPLFAPRTRAPNPHLTTPSRQSWTG